MENKTAFLTELAEVLEEPAEKVNESYMIDEEKWDSLVIITLIALIDDHFGITVAGKDLRNVKSIQELLSIIETRKNVK